MRRDLLIGLTLLAFLPGCEDPLVDPFVEGRHFTVYGYLNSFEAEHYVRVVPIRRYPEQISRPGDPQAEIDAEVFSANLATGETTQWNHRLVQLGDDSYGHVFAARFVVSGGVTYRLTVRRSDGAESTAETTVPINMEAEALPWSVEEDSVTQIVRWKNVPSVDKVDVVYCASPMGADFCVNDFDNKKGQVFHYWRSGRRVGPDWEVEVKLSRDFGLLREIAGLESQTIMELKSLQMWVTGADEKWTVYDDPDQFAQPSALNNVENGFGYWGSLGVGLFDWEPDPDALALVGVTTAN